MNEKYYLWADTTVSFFKVFSLSIVAIEIFNKDYNQIHSFHRLQQIIPTLITRVNCVVGNFKLKDKKQRNSNQFIWIQPSVNYSIRIYFVITAVVCYIDRYLENEWAIQRIRCVRRFLELKIEWCFF